MFPDVVLLRRTRNSTLCKGGTQDGGGEVGMERPTTDKTGSKGLGVDMAPASQEAGGEDLL
jgi:hypothetical protein